MMFLFLEGASIFSNSMLYNTILCMQPLAKDKMSSNYHRVAVLGYDCQSCRIPPQCSLELFDLAIDELLLLLERANLNGSGSILDSSTKAAVTYTIQGGGRMLPPASRQMVSEAMRGVEVLVAVVASTQMNWVYWEVFECMIEDSLLEHCLVVLKVIQEEGNEIEPSKKDEITADNALLSCGIIGDKWKGDACVIAEQELGGRGLEKGIADVKERLVVRELTLTATNRATKENATACKTIAKAAHSIVRGVQSLARLKL